MVKDTNRCATPQAARKEYARSKNACFICNSVDHRQALCPLKSVESEANNANFRKKNDRTAGFIKIADSRKKKLSKFEFPVQIQNNELIGYRHWITQDIRTIKAISGRRHFGRNENLGY